ncbi:hypothetical protein H2200_000046 [Cladophialophora chaetospira]|uniref:NAD(P)-binding protein n=1 Tax=Cladophialophora chaetospira TaxID=386627 RepID=A0AA39CQK1_9EURO|nr:hypothetical protein H2200_000046 [Cladophialophora chaetospira]
MTENIKTAIVTGGCSGIGLGLVKHLLSKTSPDPTWRVVIADIRPEAYTQISSSLDSSRHIFVETDVGSWSSQAALFRRAYDYSNGQIDFVAANAGTAEKEHLTLGNPTAPEDVDAEPVEPSILCTRVNQLGPFYGIKLFVHYTRRTAKRLGASSATDAATTNGATSGSSSDFTPKMVITSSCAGFYPFPVAPEYSATKHAVLALTRSLGPLLYATDKIGLNCINPAYVDTGLTPNEVTELWPKEWITPISTMLRTYDELLSPTGHVDQDKKSDGQPDIIKTGQSVECALDRLYYRQPVEYADESQRFLVENGLDMNGVWWRGMRARLEKLVAEGKSGKDISMV